MAVGSNSLGLMFKIGVDAGDAKSILQQFGATTKEALQEVITQIALFLSTTTKKVTDEQRAMLQSIQAEAAKQIKALDDAAESAKKNADDLAKHIKDAAISAREFTVGFNQARQSINEFASGNIAEGLYNLLQTFRQVGITAGIIVGVLGSIALAAYGATKAFEALTSAADDIGTRSKDDFEELQKNVEAAGDHITELQRKLSRGIVDALAEVKGASTGFMAEVIQTSGPALINILDTIAKWLVSLKPLAKAVGEEFTKAFNAANAMGRAIKELSNEPTKLPSLSREILNTLFPPLMLGTLKDQLDHADEVYGKHLDNIEEENKNFIAKPAPFDPKHVKQQKQGLDDLAQALADFDEAQRSAAEERQRIATEESHALIDRDEATTRLAAIEEDLFEAQKKRIEAERDFAQLNAKTEDQKAAASVKAENAIANARSQTDIKTSELVEKRDKENQAADEKLINAAIEEDKKERQLVLDRHAFDVQSAIDTQKEIEKATAIKDDPRSVTQAALIEQNLKAQAAAVNPLIGAWRELKLEIGGAGGIGDILKESGAAFTTWSDFASKAISGVASATENLLATFILTGKGGGQAFKALAAQIIASLAVEAGVRALMEVAYGIRDLAHAATLAADPFTAALAPGFVASAHAHFAAAAQFGIIAGAAAAVGVGIGLAGGLGGGSKAAAGAGGFGGTSDQAPGTVTINQGSPGMLGIQLLSDIHSMLSTASPGDVVTRGAEQNPVAIGQANNEAARRDGTVSREFLQISGLRTA